MNHNTFDIYQKSGMFCCKSHNFPEVIGFGESKTLAIEDMSRKLLYLCDNNKAKVNNNIKTRLENKLYCLCGVKMKKKDILVGILK